MLNISDIVKNLGGKRVLDRVSLDIPHGTFATLLGPSGCGKTTLLRIIAGFMPPDGGIIRLDGNPISRPEAVLPPESRGMGMVFQNYAVWPHMSVLDNVVYGLRVRGVGADERAQRAGAALHMVGLSGMDSRLPSELSGGQQQRVAIARSIVTEPKVLLLDEPLSNLDARLRKEMLFDLKRIQQQSKITFVYVTHDQSEALSVSDAIVLMNGGRIEQKGSPQEIYETPRNIFAATFVAAANTMKGEVVASMPGAVDVRLRGGRIARFSVAEEFVRETLVVAAFKRHNVALVPLIDAQSPGAVPGTVKRAYFVGNADEICVDVEGEDIYAFAEPRRFSPGDKVAVDIASDACRIFRRDSADGPSH